MGDGTLGRQAARDEMRRGRHLGHAIGADAAGVFGANGHDNLQLRGHDVQPLGAILTDLVHQPAATGAQQAFRLDHALDARQVLGQVAPVAPGHTPGTALGRCLRHLLLLGFGYRRLEVLESQLSVIFAELLGAFAVNRVVELGDQMLEALVGLL